MTRPEDRCNRQIPLSESLVGTTENLRSAAVGRTSMVDEHPEHLPLGRRPFTRKDFLLAHPLYDVAEQYHPHTLAQPSA